MITQRLSMLRERSGLSQKELSKKLGIARTTYAGYENGSREPDLEMLKKLADYYGKTVDYLIGSEKKESIHSLSPGEIEHIIQEAEKKHGVNLRDDPVVLAAVEQMIDILAKAKVNK